MHAAQPLPGGRFLIAESEPSRLLDIDRAGTAHATVPLTVAKPDPHRDTRLVRKLDSGNYLVCHEGDGCVREHDATGNGHSVLRVDRNGAIEWKLAQDELPGIRLAWVTTIDVLPNGHYVLGNCHAGEGQPVLVEIDPVDKRVVWRLDAHAAFGDSVSNSLLLDVATRR